MTALGQKPEDGLFSINVCDRCEADIDRRSTNDSNGSFAAVQVDRLCIHVILLPVHEFWSR